MNSSPAGRIELLFAHLFPLLFVGVSLFILGGGIMELISAHQSPNWPTASGRITSAKVYSVTGKKNTPYNADVEYSYEVNGQLHHSSQIRIGRMDSHNATEVEAEIAKYKELPSVTVFYRAGDPSFAVLEPGIHGVTWYRPAFGAVFLLFSCILARAIPNSVRRRRRAMSV
jgi:hypothetical protein